MTQENKDRAEAIGERPDVRRWIKRLERLGRDMPADIWVYVASGTPSVMAADGNGQPCMVGDSVDRDGIISTDIGGSWDGGDW